MTREPIDAEFEIIEPPRRPRIAPNAHLQAFPEVEWSFWRDDLPQLAGMVAAVLVAAFAKHWVDGFFHH